MATSGPGESPTPPSSTGSGSPSGTGGPLGEWTARRLVVALELLRLQLHLSSAPAGFANRDRAAAGRDHPAMPAMLAAAAAGAAGAAGAGPREVVVANGEGRPVPVVVVGWKIPGAAKPAGDTQDAEYRVIGPAAQPKALPAAGGWRPDAAANAMWDAAKAKAPRTAPGKKDDGEGSGVAKALAAQFGRVLAPLVAFGTLLSAQNSGMSAFGKAVNVLASTLAPILLPGIVLLAAGILSVSDVIWTRLKPNLEGFMSFVLDTAVPAVERLVTELDSLTDAVSWLWQVIKDPSKLLSGEAAGGTGAGGAERTGFGRTIDAADAVLRGMPGGNILSSVTGGTPLRDMTAGWIRHVANPLGEALGLERTEGSDALSRDFTGTANRDGTPEAGRAGGGRAAWWDERRTAFRAGGDSDAAGKKTKPGSVEDNIRLVSQSLARAMGPQASFNSITSASRNATLASLNGDPLDMKALMRQLESIQALLRAGNKIAEPKAKPRHPGQPEE